MRQLSNAGLGREAVRRRTTAGRLHRVHRGVYAVGHDKLTFEGRCMAGVLALGDGAVVSHKSAAAVWGMLKPHSGPIDVTVPGDGGRGRRADITVHRSHSLIAAVTTRRNGIAVTRPKRTLRDLHRTATQPVFHGAVRRALDLRLIDSDEIKEEQLARSELERLGFRVMRFSYRQLTAERSGVVAPLRAVLAQSSLTPNL